MMATLVESESPIGKGPWQAVGLLFLATMLPGVAAPLDALLTATPEQVAPHGYLEVGSDHMNQQLDVFKIRDSNALAAGTQAGDYHGAHMVGAWRPHDNIWLSGSLWQRKLGGLSETYSFNSWQVSGQYRFMDGDGRIPALAVRLSGWGNYADQIGSKFAADAGVQGLLPPGKLLSSIKVTKPADSNLQVDLIGSWKVTNATDLSVMLGAGKTHLSYDELSGTMLSGGTPCQFRLIGNPILCLNADGISGFSLARNKINVDVENELAWRGNFIQAGLNVAWRSGLWTLRGGYLFYAVQRAGVDDILAARGWSAFTKNQNILLEADYRLHPNLSVFARSQLSNKLFFNEIPVSYNTFSADLFGGRYSVYTVGLRADF